MNIRTIKQSAILLAGILASSIQGFAQQDAMYSQYMFNTLAINPAYAGSRDVLSVTGLYRNQWGGVEGAPITQTFTMDMPLKNEKHGIGIQAFNDQIGLYKNTGGYLTYSYKVRLTPKTTLSMGLQGGATNLRIDYTKANLSQANDGAYRANISRILPNVGAGIFISNDRAYFGFSVPYMYQHKIDGYDATATGKGSVKLDRHYFAMMGLVLPLSSTIKLKPSLMARYVQGSPLSFDGNLNFWLKDKIALGTSFRLNQINSAKQNLGDAIMGMIEMQLTPQLRLGYSHDFTINKLNNYKYVGMPTHEAMLRYEFGYGRNKILTPRYF